MSVLAVLTPLPARAADAEPRGPALGLEGRADIPWKWALSEDGRQVSSHGETPPALWPRADLLVVVVPPQALSWARTDLPRVPAARLRAALDGALEEALLEEAEPLHYALPPQARPGRPCTVAVMQRQALAQMLQALQSAGREVDRVVPAFAPTGTTAGQGADPAPGTSTHAPGQRRAHFQAAPGDGSAACQLVWADEGGVAVLPLQGDGARHLVQQAQPVQAEPITWTSTPAAAAAAEAWAGRPVAVVPEGELWLAAAASGWELRQFDLAPRHRGLRWGRDAWHQLLAPAWRPARLGLAGLVAVNVLGLQVWAWQQQQAVDARKQAQVALLKSTHPQVRVVLDAPLQMQREAERMREAAGQPGEADLEAALAAAAAAWPAGLSAPQALRFERGQLTLTTAGLTAAQAADMTERLRPLGWALESTGGRLSMTRRAAAAGRSSAP